VNLSTRFMKIAWVSASGVSGPTELSHRVAKRVEFFLLTGVLDRPGGRNYGVSEARIAHRTRLSVRRWILPIWRHSKTKT
jgi:hypothetical protein